MAPKMKLPQRRKSIREPEEIVRKKRHAQSSTVPNPVSVPAQGPSQPSISPSVNLLSDRKVETGKNIDFRFFEKEGFTFATKIKNQGWELYCSLKEVTYVDLVREFYQNLNYGNGSVTSTVKGIDICLDSRILGEILQLPSEGYSYMELPIKEEGIRIILGEAFSGSLNRLEAKLLSIEMRVLHQIVTKLFFPRSGRHDLLSGRDVCVIFHIITQPPLKPPCTYDRGHERNFEQIQGTLALWYGSYKSI